MAATPAIDRAPVAGGDDAAPRTHPCTAPRQPGRGFLRPAPLPCARRPALRVPAAAFLLPPAPRVRRAVSRPHRCPCRVLPYALPRPPRPRRVPTPRVLPPRASAVCLLPVRPPSGAPRPPRPRRVPAPRVSAAAPPASRVPAAPPPRAHTPRASATCLRRVPASRVPAASAPPPPLPRAGGDAAPGLPGAAFCACAVAPRVRLVQISVTRGCIFRRGLLYCICIIFSKEERLYRLDDF